MVVSVMVAGVELVEKVQSIANVLLGAVPLVEKA